MFYTIKYCREGYFMAKQTLSVTLAPQTIENVRKLAEEEFRTISNMIDVIVAKYVKEREGTSFAKIMRATAFGENIIIAPYSQTNDVLRRNVRLDEQDISFIGEMK